MSMGTDEVRIEKRGRAGRITLTRAKALNALSYEMCTAIEAALDAWAGDDEVALIVMDAEGERAFCAGGDIAAIYHEGIEGRYDMARAFWADEYRLNAKLFEFPKPVAAFMQGYTMGGGVGLGCHGSHRVVGMSSKMSMPECGIGLIPDVGGTLLLARAPGRLGEYLGTTGARMGPGDAIHAGFADYYIPEPVWPDVIKELEETGDWEAIDRISAPPPPSLLAALQGEVDATFGGEDMVAIVNALKSAGSEFASDTLAALAHHAPLSMCATVELIHRIRGFDEIRRALTNEYRYTWRALEQGDFIEGIRAQIIDKDRTPKWVHEEVAAVPAAQLSQMLMPLGDADLNWEDMA